MLTSHDEDIVADVLNRSLARPDALYVLDGSDTRDCLPDHLDGYWRDSEVPYDGPPRDGWRQWLLEHAVRDHGPDHLFVLVHSDEVWTFDPRDLAADHPADGWVVRLPVHFPRQRWDDSLPPLDQLHWSLGPGWPEFRMFRGAPHVHYRVDQHFDVRPVGIDLVAVTDRVVEHYPYRSPLSQMARAKASFDPDNYRHVDDCRTVWNDEMIRDWQRQPYWRELRCA